MFFGIKSDFFDFLFGYGTYLGGFYVAVGLFLFFIWYLITIGEKRMAFLFSLTFILAEMSSYILKHLINRSRPLTAFGEELSPSFPSGHSLTAMIIYGLVVCSFLLLKEKISQKLFYISFFSALIIILTVGFSRIYLGLHYFTDVLGGYFVGLFWIFVFFSVFKKYSNRFDF